MDAKREGKGFGSGSRPVASGEVRGRVRGRLSIVITRDYSPVERRATYRTAMNPMMAT